MQYHFSSLGVAMLGRFFLCTAVLSLSLLGGCDRLGIADPAKEAAIREADGKATGSACRHAGRAIEDCYSLNPDASRAAIYAGWVAMNDYMRENNIQEVKPTVAASSASGHASEESHASASESASASASESASASASSSSKSH